MVTTKDGQWERPQRTRVCVCVSLWESTLQQGKVHEHTHTHRYVFTTSSVQPRGKVRVHLFDGYSSNPDTDVHWCADALLSPATGFEDDGED